MFRLALSLCPAVAVTTTVMNGLTLGVAVLLVQVLSSGTVALVRGAIHPRVRIPIYTIIIAVWVSAIDMLLSALAPALYAQVGALREADRGVSRSSSRGSSCSPRATRWSRRCGTRPAWDWASCSRW